MQWYQKFQEGLISQALQAGSWMSGMYWRRASWYADVYVRLDSLGSMRFVHATISTHHPQPVSQGLCRLSLKQFEQAPPPRCLSLGSKNQCYPKFAVKTDSSLQLCSCHVCKHTETVPSEDCSGSCESDQAPCNFLQKFLAVSIRQLSNTAPVSRHI